MNRWLGSLSFLGGIAAVPLMIAFAATGFGEPGTVAYQKYELLNRLMAGPLLLMTAGWLGAWQLRPHGFGRWGALLGLIGSLVMALGNGAEFWLFSDLPYGAAGNGRDLSWIAFSLGGLVRDIGATVFGVAIWRAQRWPPWSGTLLMLALLLDLLGFFAISPFFASAVLAITLGYCLRGDWSSVHPGASNLRNV